MKKFMLLCLFGSGLWVFFASADLDIPTHSVPAIRIGADGSLPADGSQCVPVDDDGVARVNFISPPHIKDQEEEGFDYDRYDFYLSVVAAKHGRFPMQSSFVPGQTSIYQEVISSTNAGKTICFTKDADIAVPSYFETIARYFGLIGTLRMLEASVGAGYRHFPGTSYPGSIPALTMLHNQLEMGKDLRQMMALKANASSTMAGLVSAGLLSTAYLFFPESLFTPITNLGTAGSFALFYSAPVDDGLLIAVDDGIATPIGELISPANGTRRQPGSLLASHTFRGPFMLASLYGSQNYWTGPGAGKAVNSLMVSLTIVTTYSTRTFIREIGNNFFDNGELLSYLYDGFLMISIASVDDPSNVIAIYRDENFKGRTNELLGTYQHYSGQMKDVDEFFAQTISMMERILMWTPIFMGLQVAHPLTATMTSHIIDGIKASLPLVVLVGMNKARDFRHRMSGSLAKTGKALANLPGISHIAKLRPKTMGSGIPFDTKANAGKALGLSFSFNFAGPGFRSLVHYLSVLLTDLGDPGSAWHRTFQTGRQFVIGHYVMP